MGRPIKEKYFGNTNSPYSNQAVGGTTGLGGEGVASVVLNALGNYTTRPTFAFSAPQLAGGTTATGTITSEGSTVAPDGTLLNGVHYVVGDLVTFAGITGVVGRVATVGSGQGEIQAIDFTGTGTSRSSFTTLPTNKTTLAVTVAGNVSGGAGSTGTGQTVAITFRAKEVVITEAGSGYTAAPTSTPTQSVSFTSVALTSTKQNAIKGLAFLPGGSAKLFDIKKQEGSRRYLVNTADGRGICKLVATPTVASGEMNIIATDTNGSTYFVKKLTARRAVLVQSTASGSFVYADGGVAGWTLSDAGTGIVSIANN